MNYNITNYHLSLKKKINIFIIFTQMTITIKQHNTQYKSIKHTLLPFLLSLSFVV